MNVSNETGRSQQVCKSHVSRNTDALVEELTAIIQSGQDHSLEAMGIMPDQALANLAMLRTLIHSRQPEDQPQLEHMNFDFQNRRGFFRLRV
jgi:hypothetical protein